MPLLKARIRRLLIWFVLNSIIFIVCYLNYRLQLKHRYLYKTLNAGLCFSRAAAMVINFNLLLVWLPMCKYSLTRLAYLGNRSLNLLKEKHNKLISPTSLAVIELSTANNNDNSLTSIAKNHNNKLPQFKEEFKFILNEFILRTNIWFLEIKINSINNFLLAVDHCKSLHTICATTITIASVIHTVAHLINVINFSNNFEPLLSNLNMAEYKGQNPLHLLISVPGITGCLMIIILVLMSLSSIDFIRNSSYDLFQIFHRLSIIFVLLLFLHPSRVEFDSNFDFIIKIFQCIPITIQLTLCRHLYWHKNMLDLLYSHVLKEQTNVSRHHPDICSLNNFTNMIIFPLSTTATTLKIANNNNNSIELNNIAINKPKINAQQQAFSSNVTLTLNSLVRQNSIAREEKKIQILNITNTTSNNKNLIETNFNNTKNQTNTINDLKNPETIELKSTQRQSIPETSTRTIRDKVEWTERNKVDSSGSVVSNFSNISSSNHRINIEGILMVNNNNINSSNNDSIQGMKIISREETTIINDKFCLDPLPSFVAQSSICWYVLSIGLSCYLTDLLLRRKRRSKTSIELLNVRLDREGNLVELILNNNHKRFAYWLPGQFVYLNCPQIAQYEWHPFTISSMDNKNRQFTLHIKTGGDWTRKLRQTLECKLSCNNPMSLSSTKNKESNNFISIISSGNKNNIKDNLANNLYAFGSPISTEYIYNNCREAKQEIECTRLVRIVQYGENKHDNTLSYENYHNCDCVKIELGNKIMNNRVQRKSFYQSNNKKQDILMTVDNSRCSCSCKAEERSLKSLDLFIDGPFHSPFERLLEQEISICVANGVGWTAFSSVFHCIINSTMLNKNNSLSMAKQNDWWYKWSNFAVRQAAVSTNSHKEAMSGDIKTDENIFKNYFPKTKLHLMIIVTSIEQLKPFYHLAINYFERILHQELNDNSCTNSYQMLRENPIREISAYITREIKDDKSVLNFCRQENLVAPDESNSIRVNEMFSLIFGKPNLEFYLESFKDTYSDSSKLSIYCCGSYHVKKSVQEICKNLNKMAKNTIRQRKNPIYSYHEENF